MARARFAGLLFLWAPRASSGVAYETGRHPICGVLEGNDHRHRPNELPAEYTCRGGSEEGAITCSPSSTFVSEPAPEPRSSGSASDEQRAATTGGLSGHAPAVSSAVEALSARSTWLVCEGNRDKGTAEPTRTELGSTARAILLSRAAWITPASSAGASEEIRIKAPTYRWRPREDS
ncbi:unnamed protein product, partial [Scytosiphon promiscuus]